MSDRDRRESELVIAAQAGDVRAFDELARTYRRALWFEARQVLDEARAEDAVQDALLIAFKSLPKLREVSRFPAWIRALTRHRALRIAAGEARQASALDALLIRYSQHIAFGPEDRIALESELGGLPPTDQQVMALHYFEDWSIAQIATFLNQSESNVKWRMHLARKKLRARLEPSPCPEIDYRKSL